MVLTQPSLWMVTPMRKEKRAYSSLAGGNSNFDKQKKRSSLLLPHHPPLFHFCWSFLVYGTNERWNSITWGIMCFLYYSKSLLWGCLISQSCTKSWNNSHPSLGNKSLLMTCRMSFKSPFKHSGSRIDQTL